MHILITLLISAYFLSDALFYFTFRITNWKGHLLSIASLAIIFFIVYPAFLWLSQSDMNFAIVGFMAIYFTLFYFFIFFLKPYFFLMTDKRFQSKNLEEVLSLKYFLSISGTNVKIYFKDKLRNNAYAYGGFNFFKAILFDKNLFETFSPTSRDAICLHEYAHLSQRHLIWRYIFFVVFLSSLYFLKLLSKSIIHHQLSLDILFVFVMTILLFPLMALLFKHQEHQADIFSAKLVGRDNYIKALHELNEAQNGKMNNFSWTHPTLNQRIERVNSIVKFD